MRATEVLLRLCDIVIYNANYKSALAICLYKD